MGIGFHVPVRLFTDSCCLACLFWPCCVTGYMERSSLSKIVAKSRIWFSQKMLQGKRCWTCSFQEETNMAHLVVFFRTCAAPKLGDKHSKKDCPLYQGLKAYAKRQTFMRRTKLSELGSWKSRRLAQSSSSEWVWIVQHVLSVCFRRIECLKIVSGTNVSRYTLPNKQMNQKFVL